MQLSKMIYAGLIAVVMSVSVSFAAGTDRDLDNDGLWDY